MRWALRPAGLRSGTPTVPPCAARCGSPPTSAWRASSTLVLPKRPSPIATARSSPRSSPVGPGDANSHREPSQVFYETNENKHGLRHDPFTAIVGPRPIGWIATVSKDVICNIGPYSFFNAVGEKPHFVMFSSSGRKDSLRNAEETGEFTCSLATWDLRLNMNMTSAAVPYGVDEFPIGELTAVPGTLVKAPRVKESPAALACKFWQTGELPPLATGAAARNWVVFGQVVGVHIDDRFIKDGMVDTGAMQPIGRLGYMDYSVVTPQSIFAINRPSVEEAMVKLAAKAGVKAAE